MARLATCWLTLIVVCAPLGFARADGPKDNLPDQVRQIPPLGIEISGRDRIELEQGLGLLEQAIADLQKRKDVRTQELLPDVQIFARAVRQGLAFQEFYAPKDIDNAKKLLAEGQRRAEELASGMPAWVAQKGLVVRGFRSRIDGTVQPYGLVIPQSYVAEGPGKFRLDLWLHGRGEKTGETQFIAERMGSLGQFAPRDTFVLHPYGRYSNAFKFAGEVDVLEALDHAEKHYRIDDNRIAVRGFSMGGAGCWQLAVHYPDRFFAANPGAGFCETPEFLKSFQGETLNPTWYEQKLWQMYDCPGYAINLYQLPTVAYSGEIDKQKQAADVMEQTLARLGLRLTHLIGPQTGHAIHADSKIQITQKLDQLAETGRERLPLELRFATYTLKYNRVHWLTVTGLGQHWEQAAVTARLLPAENRIAIDARNVTGLKLSIPAGRSPFAPDREVTISLLTGSNDSAENATQRIVAGKPGSDRSWDAELSFDGRQWQLGPMTAKGLAKRHDLQGPIDDAFMDSFIVVRPTGQPQHEAVGKWTGEELDHFVSQWRQQFRGDAIVKTDNQLTTADIASSNLILFGDPASNQYLKSILDKLPIRWTREELAVGGKQFDVTSHAPAMIFPNPLNPQRYVVLNSGFTYREYAYLNNARQVPMLPDWAIVDLRVPANAVRPGRIAEAGFFDENWQVKN